MRPTLMQFPAKNVLSLILAALLLSCFQDKAKAGEVLAVNPGIGAGTSQLVVVVADSWQSDRGRLQCFERRGKSAWLPVLDRPAAVLLGRKGLAWGRGLFVGKGARIKREGDGCSPAGVFRIGKIYGEGRRLPEGASYPYIRVTRWDAWVDDPSNPFYNRHVRIPEGKPLPVWFEKQRMRLGDPAYHWLIEIRHNSDPPSPGMGSAIFFHTRRGENRPTAGCTAMTRDHLERVITFLRAPANPLYVLLPVGEYKRYAAAWGLPDFPQ